MYTGGLNIIWNRFTPKHPKDPQGQPLQHEFSHAPAPDAQYMAALQPAVAAAFKEPPSLNEPGPIGMRKEHLITFMQNQAYVTTWVPLIAALAVGDSHKKARACLKKHIVFPLPPKVDSGRCFCHNSSGAGPCVLLLSSRSR